MRHKLSKDEADRIVWNSCGRHGWIAVIDFTPRVTSRSVRRVRGLRGEVRTTDIQALEDLERMSEKPYWAGRPARPVSVAAKRLIKVDQLGDELERVEL